LSVLNLLSFENPVTETVTEQRAAPTATTSTGFHHGVRVQCDTVVFEKGLSGDGAFYFTSLSPELEDDRYVVLVDGVRYVYEPEFASARTQKKASRSHTDRAGTEWTRWTRT